MKTSTKAYITALAASALTVLSSSTVQTAIANFVSAELGKHPALVTIFTIVSTILALVHNPQKTAKVLAFAVVALLLTSVPSYAQTDTGLAKNLYAAGVSYNIGGSPAVAGTGLYARLVADGTGTYAFTVVDALPITVKPFTVATNFAAGIAQKVVTLGKVPIFIPTAAGISYNGSNTGWAWSTGAIASIRVKTNYRILPNVRIVKSSVSNGAGYQPIVGVLFGWGQ